MDDTPALRLGDRVAWAGLIVLLLLCVMRAMIEHDPFPWWSSDPFLFAPPLTGLTPRWALLLNVGIVLSSAVVLLGQHRRGVRLGLFNGALLAIAMGMVSFHALIDPERVLDASTVGAVASVLAAGSTLGGLAGARRLLGAVVIGFALMLTAVGVYEVFVTHAQTMGAYEQGRDAFLAARGWSEGSFEAMSYERRLRNPEPVAWFGLTNVFASFVGASGAALITVGACLWGRDRRGTLIAWVMAAASVFGLYLCGSKGGYGVFVLGVALGLLVKRHPLMMRGRVLIGLCVLVIAGLALRGLLGESLGERSLLFRSQYLLGSLRVWLSDPIAGVGPGQFQQWYALLKPDLSPEDVASPHSVFFAWLATLGLGGIALTTLTARLLKGDTRVDALPEASDEPPAGITTQAMTKAALLIIVLACIASLRMKMMVLSRLDLVPLGLGLGMWVAGTLWIIRGGLSERAMRAALFVLSAVLLTHAMIEVTGTLIVSAPLWALGVSLAMPPPRSGKGVGLGSELGLGSMLAAGIVLLSGWAGINRWERALHHGARDAQQIAGVHAALNGLESSRNPELLLRDAADRLGGLLGRPVGTGLDEIGAALGQAGFWARLDSVDSLERAMAARPGHSPTRIAASQQLLWCASLMRGGGEGDESERFWDRAVGIFEVPALDTRGHRWLGSILLGRAAAFPEDPRRDAWMRAGADALRLAMERTPHDPHLAVQIMGAYLDLGDEAGARTWAARAVELHERTRLDPLRGLSPEELGRVEAVLGAG